MEISSVGRIKETAWRGRERREKRGRKAKASERSPAVPLTIYHKIDRYLETIPVRSGVVSILPRASINVIKAPLISRARHTHGRAPARRCPAIQGSSDLLPRECACARADIWVDPRGTIHLFPTISHRARGGSTLYNIYVCIYVMRME